VYKCCPVDHITADKIGGACETQKISEHRVLVREDDGRRQFARPRCRWKAILNWFHRSKTGGGGVDSFSSI
jgi:hypothetical protein